MISYIACLFNIKNVRGTVSLQMTHMNESSTATELGAMLVFTTAPGDLSQSETHESM